MFNILDKQLIGPAIHHVVIDAPIIAKKALAGQFVMVRVSEKGEKIPLTIADFDRDNGTITIVFQELGKTTKNFAELKSGDFLIDLLGPQGTPSEIANFGNTIVIGGGIGIAPIYPLARELKKAGNKVTSIIGYRSKDHVFWEDKMKSVSDRLLISTNDGSYGKKGFVTDILKNLMQQEKIDRVVAIGPAVMMKAVADLTRDLGIPTIVSLNSMMVCGMGMCGACRVSLDKATKFTCMDGPDVDGHAVNFEELMKRLDTYKPEECSCK